MREVIEFRIPKINADRYLNPKDGKSIGGFIRVVKVLKNTHLYKNIGELDSMLKIHEGKSFFMGWRFCRYYTQKELDLAEVFHLTTTAVFEPTGEQCGTIYDETFSCPNCGANRQQKSDLFIDVRKIPKNTDLCRTIANEWIVSQHFAEIIVKHELRGIELHPIHHYGRYQDDPIDFTKLKSGRELLHIAADAGQSQASWKFWVWLNQAEQAPLLNRVINEYVLSRNDRTKNLKPIPWYQLTITSESVPMVDPTRFGIDPFDEDHEGRFRCPLGHIAGLNLLSEISINNFVWDGSDFSQTKNMIGIRRGLLVPMPQILITPRLYRILINEKIRGCRVEIAHLI